MHPCDRLPSEALTDARAGRPVRLRAPQLGSVVLFLLHDADCEPCRDYLRTLSHAERACRIWGARRIAVVPGPEPSAAGVAGSTSAGFPVVADPEGDLVRRIGEPDSGVLVIADRFGECFHSARVRDHERAAFPDLDEVEEWLSFLGTQCPECGVPDSAGLGPWAASPGETRADAGA